MPHAVRLEPKHCFEVVRRYCLEIVRPLEPRRAIQHPASPLNCLEMFVRADVSRSLKEHVLEQVGKAGPALALVCGSDVIPEIHGDDRCRVIFREGYEQAVRDTVRLDRNSHSRNLHDGDGEWNPVHCQTAPALCPR